VNTSRLRIALVGHGRWGKNIARVLRRLPDCELATVCDPDPGALGALAGQVRLTTRFEDVLSDPSLQAVALCTPSGLHAAQAIAALHAGKHVFVEKPMALSQRDARAVSATVEGTSRRLMVGHIMLYHPAFRELAKLVATGELGRIRRIATLRSTSLQRRSLEDPWWALAPHDISLLTTLIDAAPTAIRASRLICDSGRESVRAELSFADGAGAEVSVGRGIDRVRRMLVVGDAGAACFRDETPPGRVDVYATPLTDWDARGHISERPARSLPVPAAEPLELELGHFVQGLLRQRPFRTDHLHGLRVSEILDAGQQSSDHFDGEPIALLDGRGFSERESA
jgi:predicted dehydrogenase